MSRSTPGPSAVGKLRWASDDVLTGIEQQVQPKVSLPRRLAQTTIVALVFTWPPAFVVLATATVVAPASTNDASIGTTALWALQFAVLIAVTALVTPLRSRSAGAARPPAAGTDTPAAAPDTSTRLAWLGLATNALLSAGCAWLMLALQGLSVNQVATLTVVLVVVLHLLPLILILSRMLRQRRRS
ncbi:hypothetical protein [Micromonospora sp. LOL_024]|uniref:hypothetical protein n=1 Tax=Micromonospora sp. LOL_024 TaxID=3345412 RepID=UPI003A8BCF69